MRAAAVAANKFISERVSCILFTVLALMIASSPLCAQNITVSPASLTFTKTIVDVTSAAKSVTISNNGASSQAVNIVMSGDFSETDNCGGNLAGGSSCTMHVTFTPTIAGSITGAASLYDGSHNLLAFVGMTGSGGAPVTTTPASLAFGPVSIRSEEHTSELQSLRHLVC